MSFLLQASLRDGQIEDGRGSWLYAEMYLSGLVRLARMLLSHYRDYGAKTQVELKRRQLLPPDLKVMTEFYRRQLRTVGLEERKTLAVAVAALSDPDDWPSLFLDVSHSIKFWPSALLKDGGYMPYWFYQELKMLTNIYSPWRKVIPHKFKYNSYDTMVGAYIRDREDSL